MSIKMKALFGGLVAAVLSAMASPVLAQAPTVCNIFPAGGTPGYYDTQIAVASNFYDAMQNYVDNVFNPSTGYYVNICQNSTAELLSEINSGSGGYSLFLAANTTAPTSLFTAGTHIQSGATVKLYAKGVPVLFGVNGIVNDTHTLIPNIASGSVATPLTGSNLSGFPMNTTSAATPTAVADPTAAPYGAAAQAILTSMGATWSPPTSPNWLTYPLFPNIDLTFQAVAGPGSVTDVSGFVSKGQICSGIGFPSPDYVYVEFTNSNFTLQQSGILTLSGNTGQNTIGASLFSAMLGNVTAWNEFLDENCYGAITGSRLFLHNGVFKHKKKPFHAVGAPKL